MNKAKKSVWMGGVVLWIAAALLGACEAPLECGPGELRFDGRPPRRLFEYDRSCREDCFSSPLLDPGEPRCDPECARVITRNPGGLLLDDRQLLLADLESLGNNRALVFYFGFVDEAGGTAPDAWGLTRVGPRTYLDGEIEGTARFDMQVGVVDMAQRADSDLWILAGATEDPMAASPARLEILETAGRLAGRFFLAWTTEIGQPQGEVVGCFNVQPGPVVDVAGTTYQMLSP